MQLNVPFVPDSEYVDFLNQLGGRLYAVHYSLEDPMICDARVRIRKLDPELLIESLRCIPAPRKYLLANGRFHSPRTYSGSGGLPIILRRMEQLRSESLLDGVVFSDPYLLFALSDSAPDLVSGIEAVPSVNFMIDSIRKLDAVMEIIGQSRFSPPSKIPLDRGMNRRPGELSDLVAIARRLYPGVKIELLANEGCWNHCPFRITHDAMIAACNAGIGMDTLRISREIGCVRIMSRSPHLILGSPFIRPEDLNRYNRTADIIKICGRTLGKAFLIRAVGAYVDGRFSGNLFSLLDASNWMAEKFHIHNELLPDNFFDLLTACPQGCRSCHVCRDVFNRFAEPLPFRFTDFRSG